MQATAPRHERQTAERPAAANRRRWIAAIPFIIGAVAFGARLVSLLRMGGFQHLMGYDEGVYFSAATGFTSGLMPYRDFVLMHPPGILLLLSPFAALSHVTSDTTGWTAARLAIMCLGAVNSVLVYVIARRVSLVAGIVAGGLYAIWSPAVWVERTTMLEAFVLLGLLLALWAIRDPHETRRRLILGGTFLGLATSVKLWGLVPLVVIIAWLLAKHAWRPAALVAGAAAAALALVLGPFFALAPQRMVDLIVLAQLDRGGAASGRLFRVRRMLNIDVEQITAHTRLSLVVTGIAVILVVLAIAITWWRLPVTRLWSSLLVVQSVVLLLVPVYFKGYSSFIAPALMLVVGSAVALCWSLLAERGAAVRVAGLASIVVVLAVAIVVNVTRSDIKEPLDHAGIAAAAPLTDGARCVGSDSAGLLILTNVLSRSLDNGCPAVFDFDGSIYAVDAGRNPEHLDSLQRRRASADYQALLASYIESNDVMMMHRLRYDGLTAATRSILKARPLLLKTRGLAVYGSGN